MEKLYGQTLEKTTNKLGFNSAETAACSESEVVADLPASSVQSRCVVA